MGQKAVVAVGVLWRMDEVGLSRGLTAVSSDWKMLSSVSGGWSSRYGALEVGTPLPGSGTPRAPEWPVRCRDPGEARSRCEVLAGRSGAAGHRSAQQGGVHGLGCRREELNPGDHLQAELTELKV